MHFLKILFIYLFIYERGARKEKERERNINVWLPLPCPLLGTGHVPWLEMKPVTFQFSGWHSIHWATPARVQYAFIEWMDECLNWALWGVKPESWLLHFLPYFIWLLFSDVQGYHMGPSDLSHLHVLERGKQCSPKTEPRLLGCLELLPELGLVLWPLDKWPRYPDALSPCFDDSRQWSYKCSAMQRQNVNRAWVSGRKGEMRWLWCK